MISLACYDDVPVWAQGNVLCSTGWSGKGYFTEALFLFSQLSRKRGRLRTRLTVRRVNYLRSSEKEVCFA